jgi:hypothetical protein
LRLTTEGWKVRLVDMVSIPAGKLCPTRTVGRAAHRRRRGSCRPCAAAKSPLLDAMRAAGVKRPARDPARSGPAAAAPAFPQFSTTYSQQRQGQKKFGRRSSATRIECEQPLSPFPRPHAGLLLPKGWAERHPLWIRRPPLARLPVPSLNRRAARRRLAPGHSDADAKEKDVFRGHFSLMAAIETTKTRRTRCWRVPGDRGGFKVPR